MIPLEWCELALKAENGVPFVYTAPRILAFPEVQEGHPFPAMSGSSPWELQLSCSTSELA